MAQRVMGLSASATNITVSRFPHSPSDLQSHRRSILMRSPQIKATSLQQHSIRLSSTLCRVILKTLHAILDKLNTMIQCSEPKIFATGSEDVTFQANFRTNLAAKLENGKVLYTIVDAGHLAPLSSPQKTSIAITIVGAN